MLSHALWKSDIETTVAWRFRTITFNESSFLTALIRMYLLPSNLKTRSQGTITPQDTKRHGKSKRSKADFTVGNIYFSDCKISLESFVRSISTYSFIRIRPFEFFLETLVLNASKMEYGKSSQCTAHCQNMKKIVGHLLHATNNSAEEQLATVTAFVSTGRILIQLRKAI